MGSRLRDLESQIQALIQEQRYEDAQDLLPVFGREVIAICNSAGAEEDFFRAKEFAKSTLELIRCQRAHDANRLTELRQSRAYLQKTLPDERLVDLSG